MNLQEVRVQFKKKDIVFEEVVIDDEHYKIRRIEAQSRFNNIITFQLKTTTPYTSIMLQFDSEKLIFQLDKLIESKKDKKKKKEK